MSEPRVCVVLLTGLGDVVHGLPVANAIRRTWPGAHITWVAEPAPSYVIRPHEAVDDVVVYHKSQGIAGVRRLWQDLRNRTFDITLNLNVYAKSVWPTLFFGAPRRIGFNRQRAFEGVWLTSNDHLADRPRAHTQDMFLEFLEKLGVPADPVEWRISFTAEEQRLQHEFFQPLRDRPIVSVVPASANVKKDWPAKYAAALVDALERDFGFRVVLVGGPGERETRTAREISAGASTKPVWAMGDGVRRMMWMIAGSDLVIAPDTGPVHVARACGVPVIGLYGHTNPWRVGPWRKYEDLWIDHYTERGAAPDAANATPKLGRMETITVREVLESVERAIDVYRVGKYR